jgi:hypothetical protein
LNWRVLPPLAKAKFLQGLREINARGQVLDFSVYQNDPLGFGEKVLGYRYAPDIQKIMTSVLENEITIAQSCNGPGKTHSGASLACWFKLAFGNRAKVFCAAAPPETNLKTLLWGEIQDIIAKHPTLFDGYSNTSLMISDGPQSFIQGLTIPTSGTPAIREAKFCTDAEELFELTDGSIVTYGDLIGKKAKVISVDSKFNKIKTEAEFFDNGIEDVYEIILSSGYKINRTGKHPLYSGKIAQSFKKMAGTHVKGRYRVDKEIWSPVDSLHVGDAVLSTEDTSFNFGSRLMDPNEIKVIAYLIGDGCITDGYKILFIQENNTQLKDFREAVTSLGSRLIEDNPGEYSWRVAGKEPGRSRWGSNPVRELLKNHCLIGKNSATKRVPNKINHSTRECISLFLNRLFSTDGHACMCKAGAYKKAEVGYTSKSELLVKDIQRLLYRFGISSKVSTGKKSWTHKGIKKFDYYWYLTICRAKDIILFADRIGIYGKESALDKCVNYAKTRQACATWRNSKYKGFCWEKIRSIKPIGKRPTVGVNVPVNNTYLTNLVEHNSGKHADYLLFIIDEGDAVPDEVYRGIEACMSGGIMVRLLVLFNPRAQQGEVYRMIRDNRANVVHLSAFSHPNVLTGENLFPGAVTREKVIQRINKWCRPLVGDEEKGSEETFTLPEYLVGQTSKNERGQYFPPLQAGVYVIKDSAFSYMVLGQYPAQGTQQLISREWIYNARARWDAYVAQFGEVPPAGSRPSMGLDVAEFGDDSNVATFKYGGWVEMPIRWEGVDRTKTSARAAVEYKHRSAFVCKVDASGIGYWIAPNMDGCNAHSVFVGAKPTMRIDEGIFNSLRSQLQWQVREWLRTDPGAMLPPDEFLIEELGIPTYKYNKKGLIEVMDKDTAKEILKRSPDSFDSLCLHWAPIDVVVDVEDVERCAV